MLRISNGYQRRGWSARDVCIVVMVALMTVLCPRAEAAQVEASAGLLFVPEASVGGNQVGPMVSVTGTSDVLGLPLFLEVGVARTDFASLGQNYHHNHVLLSLGAEWLLTQGSTRLGFRVGLGAYGEFETVEGDPSVSGGGGWVETVIPGLVLEHELGGGKRLVARVSDAILGPWFAVLDSDEYSIEHRLMFVLGVRF